MKRNFLYFETCNQTNVVTRHNKVVFNYKDINERRLSWKKQITARRP